MYVKPRNTHKSIKYRFATRTYAAKSERVQGKVSPLLGRRYLVQEGSFVGLVTDTIPGRGKSVGGQGWPPATTHGHLYAEVSEA